MKWTWKVLCLTITDSLVFTNVSPANTRCALIQTMIILYIQCNMKWTWKVLCLTITDSLVFTNVSPANTRCALVQTMIILYIQCNMKWAWKALCVAILDLPILKMFQLQMHSVHWFKPCLWLTMSKKKKSNKTLTRGSYHCHLPKFPSTTQLRV